MMKTPIVDFVRNYSDSRKMRLHMPGHKGSPFLGCEMLDITEVSGADVLYSPEGIISESENNASILFESGHTYYSVEGSSLCIKAMLAAAVHNKKDPLILAARNVHKAFVYACALLDIDVEWLYAQQNMHLCSCLVTPEQVEKAIREQKKAPCAVYLTSPDYLGNIQDIKGIAEVCHKYGILLLVDNAHGAYLKFCKNVELYATSKSVHPIQVGADMCCDSAHKTLPVLTGGAYLHISKNADGVLFDIARDKLGLFASTSPSYLILQSLDLCNAYIENGYGDKLYAFCMKLAELKNYISNCGFELMGEEPLKIVINMTDKCTTGAELANYLRCHGIETEFADNDFCVMMFTPEISDIDIERLKAVLSLYPIKDKTASDFEICKKESVFYKPQRVMSIRSAVLGENETIDAKLSQGRVCASPTVSCPPAVPIVMSGEKIESEHIELFEYYGIDKISVVK